MFKTYTINDSENFDINLYPEIESEIFIISYHLRNLHTANKTEIVISYLKDHCVKTVWIQDNADVVNMITSGFLSGNQTEALFNACRHDPGFLADFEHYIASRLM